MTIIPEIQALTQRVRIEAPQIQNSYKKALYDFFEQRLVRGKIALGRYLLDADIERKPIDTVVIHHTGNPPGLRTTRLSAIGLLRLYGPYFAGPRSERDKNLKGQPIVSGHARNGKQEFWAYHWIIRRDGSAERLLYDSEIGWHAGDWDVNCRGIAIVLDNDYEANRPSDCELEGVAKLIRTHYRHVPLARIVGHQEVNPRTSCPSKFFLNGPSNKGWKADLLRLLT